MRSSRYGAPPCATGTSRPTGFACSRSRRARARSSCSSTASPSSGGRGGYQLPALAERRLPGGRDRPAGLRALRQARRHLRRAVANACLAGLVPALGAEQCVIAGHDWGGLLVWPFARRYPELLAGVVGVNTPDLPRTPMATDRVAADGRSRTSRPTSCSSRTAARPSTSSAATSAASSRRCSAARRPDGAEVFDDDAIDLYVEQFCPAGALTPPLEYYRNLDRNWEHAAGAAGAPSTCRRSWCRPPTIRCSRRPWPTGWRSASRTSQRVVIEDCGHWTQQEQPEAFNNALLGFLDTLPRWS